MKRNEDHFFKMSFDKVFLNVFLVDWDEEVVQMKKKTNWELNEFY